MKCNLKKLFYSFIFAIICGIILCGIITDLLMIKVVLGAVFSVLTALLLIDTACRISETITYFVEHKKKTKDKWIRLRVIYSDPDGIIQQPFYRIFTDKTLSPCVQQAIKYAKLSKCVIDSMEQLTTEE